MSATLLVCLDPSDAVAHDGRKYLLWDRVRDEYPAGYYEPPFPEHTVFEGVTGVAFSAAVVASALDLGSQAGTDVRHRFRWFAQRGRLL